MGHCYVERLVIQFSLVLEKSPTLDLKSYNGFTSILTCTLYFYGVLDSFPRIKMNTLCFGGFKPIPSSFPTCQTSYFMYRVKGQINLNLLED